MAALSNNDSAYGVCFRLFIFVRSQIRKGRGAENKNGSWCVARLLFKQRGVFVIKISTPSSLSSVEREERNFLSAKAALSGVELQHL